MSRSPRRSPWGFVPLAVMMAAIFAVSAQPGDSLEMPEFLPFDKAWHMLEYGLLASAALFALHPIRPTARTTVLVGVIAFATLYGLSDEWHQSFVPLRTACLADVAADTLGAALVSAIWWWRQSAPTT